MTHPAQIPAPSIDGSDDPRKVEALKSALKESTIFRGSSELNEAVESIGKEGFLRDAQRTENLKIAIARRPVVSNFGGLFASFGSCFAQNLQKWLTSYGFQFWFERDISAHYSTESMANAIAWVAEGRTHTPDELYPYRDARGGVCAYRYNLKKRFFGAEGEARALALMAQRDAECAQAIRQCEYLVLTLGTSRVIRFRHNHDLINAALGIGPENWYSEMLSVAANVAQLERIWADVLRLRCDRPPVVFLTVSPQRYLFSGVIPELGDTSPFVDNMLGKSILRVAVSEFLARHPQDPIHYFPAYEIVMEELRHFESLSTYDFMHINQDLTPKRVVKRFLQAYASDRILALLPLIELARTLIEHRAELVAGGLDAAHDPELARQVVSLLEKLKCVCPVDQVPPALLLPLVDLVRGCKLISSQVGAV